jgi:aryl-alcohol dehydrogenase-like predicted oxidoreductase
MFEKGRLGLGTVQFGLPYGISNTNGQTALDESHRILQVASENGINILDTAVSYGQSESTIGSFHSGNFKVVTKIPFLNLESPQIGKQVTRHFNSSRLQLNSDSVYGLLLHRPDQLLEPRGKEIWHELEILKNTGVVEKIGISISSFFDLDTILNQYAIDLVQAPFNPFDQRLISGGWLKRLKSQGVEIHSRSAFLQGLLLMEQHEIPMKFHRWASNFDHWHTSLRDLGISPLEACLQFPFSIPEIDCVLVGVNSVVHLGEILGISQKEFVDDYWSSFECNDDLLISPSLWERL